MTSTTAAPAGAVGVLVAMFTILPGLVSAQRAGPEQLLSMSVAVQDADYRADLAGLRRLHSEMEPLLRDSTIARDARYWRGFALWRRALNAANLNMPVESILADFENAATEFDEALAIDPAYVEAKIGLAAGLMNAAHFRRADFARSSELMTRALRTLADARSTDPDNPRLAFVAAARTYWAPAEYGGDRRRAIQDIEHALQRPRSEPDRGSPLEPTWGTPELHMQLAFFYLNLPTPELDAARRHAQVALDSRPDWHYVRDILFPQIEAAAKRPAPRSGERGGAHRP